MTIRPWEPRSKALLASWLIFTSASPVFPYVPPPDSPLAPPTANYYDDDDSDATQSDLADYDEF